MSIENEEIKRFYNSKKLRKVDCDYYIIIGKRSNGKSFDIKSLCLKEAYEDKGKFVYLRRWNHDRTAAKTEKYFMDNELFNKVGIKDYKYIQCYTDNIYLGNVDEKGKKTRDKLVGYSMALSNDTHYKSLVYPDVKNVIFEEFITDSGYLGNDEPTIFSSILSTVARDKKVTVYMIGNTINRFCPYFSDWGININDIKKGEITYYTFKNGDNTIKVGIEYCNDSINTGKMILGKSAKMIDGGEWQTAKVPLVRRDTRADKLLFKFYVKKENSLYKALVLNGDGEPYIYVYPYNKPDRIKDTDRFFTDNIEMQNLRHCEKLTPKLTCDILINELYKINRVCYSDALTGTEFEIIRKERGWK